MRVKFKLGDPVWRKAGQREVTVEAGGPGADTATVGDALAALAAAYPEAADEMHLGSRESDFYYSLFLNDRQVLFSHRAATPLQEGDVLSVLLPLAGG